MHRSLLPLIVILIFIVCPDLYIGRVLLKGSPLWARLAHLIPSVSLLVIIALAALGVIDRYTGFTLMFGIILCLVIPKFLFMIFSAIGRIGGFASIGNGIGYGLSIAFLLAAFVGMTFGWKLATVKQVSLSFKDLPESFDGYKIVQFSDWHLGTYNKSPETIQKEIDKAHAQNPDIIVFTGDIVNGDPEELEPFVSMLSTLHAKDGVYSVMGNHDYCMYGNARTQEEIDANIIKIQNMERQMGWKLLLNENEVITRGEDTLAVVGVENDGRPPFPQKGDLSKAQDGLSEGIFKILLSHDPTHWKREVLPESDIQLTLSGHTHAMQFKIGRFSPSRLAYSEWGGMYTEGDRKLYVSTGSGGNVAFRFGAWPQVTVITLHKEN